MPSGVPGPLRVVYVGHVARLSGGELALSRLVAALGDRVEAHVILAEDGPLVPLLRERGARVHLLPLADQVRDVRRDQVARAALQPRQLVAGASYLRRLASRIRGLDPDIVHLNTLKAGVYGSVAARLARVPVVWHVRDRVAADYLPGPTARALRTAIRWLPDAAVANSHATLRTIDPPRRGASVIYNVGPLVAASARAGGPFRIGIVGRLAPWKGQDVFLRAFAQAFDGDSEARAVIVGAPLFGEEGVEATLRELGEELGIADRVDFRGFREDVRSELERFDVLAHASTAPEPFGQVVLEGLAAGLPVVATREGGPSEIVSDGTSGLLYPAGDVGALAAALRRLHDDPALRDRLATGGLARAADFAPEPVADQMLALYDRLLRGAR